MKILLILALVLTGEIQARPSQSSPLSAEDSDPRKMRWMMGAPPARDKIITQPDSVFFSFPKLRWSVCNLRQFLPTKVIQRDSQRVTVLPIVSEQDRVRFEDRIDALTFPVMDSSEKLTWKESLGRNYTDGILILHRNKLIYEKYFGCLDQDAKHAAMSMTKSVTGLLTELLISEGKINEKSLIRDIIPEIGNSAFADATVRQVLDMTTALQFSEDYSNPKADIWIYSIAASPFPKPKSYKGPNGYWEYLKRVKKAGKHGEVFGYKTINSDMLGWVLTRVTGKPLTELVSEKLWKPMGAEQDAYMTVDGYGVPFAGGGLTANLRDLGRLGLVMLNRGKLYNKRILPASVVEKVMEGGDRARFGSGFPTLKSGSYASQWWSFHNKNEAFAARGVHGQTVYIDPKAEMVIVRFASHPEAKNGKIDPTSLPAYEAVAEFLMSQTSQSH